ncbi:MAG: toll/interleukin-1 receptor domain-containing protein, partial [Ruminococcus sp.]|nr:toll/interleukin-1 receptor domain-containing protein [Ruminococcus sp.]
MKIFVSHSKKDNDLYSMVANMLVKHGYIVIDSVSIGIGEKWIDKVKQELNSSDCLIALITENYLNSSWNSTELGYAVLNMKIHVLPVLLNNIFMPNVLMGYK